MTKEYIPGGAEVDDAMVAYRACSQMIRHCDTAKLDDLERKSPLSFSFGTDGFLLPERSNMC